METITHSEFPPDFMEEPKRPSFLTVICILSWIAIGILFLGVLNNLFNQPTPEEMAEKIEQIRPSFPSLAEKMEVAYENRNPDAELMSNVITLVCLLISTIGVTMMWQLKRKGFYVYLAGEILPYIGYFAFGMEAFKSGMSDSDSTASGIGMILFLVITDAVFIAMYAANLKHMKN